MLVGCTTSGSGPATVANVEAPAAFARERLVGRWGVASFHTDKDRPRTEREARAQCNLPYTIAKGPTDGVMMHAADDPKLYELRLKGDRGGPDLSRLRVAAGLLAGSRDFVGDGQSHAHALRRSGREPALWNLRIRALQRLTIELKKRRTGICQNCERIRIDRCQCTGLRRLGLRSLLVFPFSSFMHKRGQPRRRRSRCSTSRGASQPRKSSSTDGPLRSPVRVLQVSRRACRHHVVTRRSGSSTSWETTVRCATASVSGEKGFSGPVGEGQPQGRVARLASAAGNDTRQPYLPRFMAGGPGNPMGAPARSISDRRYFASTAPTSRRRSGMPISSGCFRLANGDIIDLYERVPVGTKVVVRHGASL